MKNNIFNKWWQVPKQELLSHLGVDPIKGLIESQVTANRVEFGENKQLEEQSHRSVIDIIFQSVQEPMMLLLLAIAILSFIFGKISNAVAMVLEVVMYAILELANKFRADRIMFQLQNLAQPTAKVIRNGVVTEIKSTELVVGDVLILSAGVLIGADARLLVCHGLSVNESSLTGESLPVEKRADDVLPESSVSISQRINSVFAGTMVVNGEGTAIVMAVGKNSELGKISVHVAQYQEERTILETTMDQFAKILAIFAIVISLIIPVVGFYQGLNVQEMVLTWLALTFLMIPCQPPIIITMALSFAAFLLAKKQVIAKRLFGIEGIGQVSAIVSDKTGTITESSMKFESFYTLDGEVKTLPVQIEEILKLALPDYCHHVMDKAVALILPDRTKHKTQVAYSGFSQTQSWRDLVYQDGSKFLHVITGEPEMLLNLSAVSADQKQQAFDFITAQASKGCKLIAYAYVYTDAIDLQKLSDLQFLAMVVVKDPVRVGVKDAIATLQQAGIKTFIVTGDHAATAQAVALQIGFSGDVITGEQFDHMADQQLANKLEQSHIFARMDPLQKLRLVTILKQQGEVVATIGDGINDAPALKAANVGIAMGHIGTDLAKEVSDLILTDDNYVHLPDAIAIGRTALYNFKKGLTFYMAAKFVLLLLFIVPLFLAIPFPFAPMQIILIELIMDIASSTMFVLQDAEPDVMQNKPERVLNFLGSHLFFMTFKSGIALALGVLFLYITSYYQDGVVVAQTVALVTWLLGHILLALNLARNQPSLFTANVVSHKIGLFWLGMVIFVSMVLTSVSWVQPYLGTTILPLMLWIKIIAVAVGTTCWIEVAKRFGYRFFVSK